MSYSLSPCARLNLTAPAPLTSPCTPETTSDRMPPTGAIPLANVDTRTASPVPTSEFTSGSSVGMSPLPDKNVTVHASSPCADGPVRDTRTSPKVTRLFRAKERAPALVYTERGPVLAVSWKKCPAKVREKLPDRGVVPEVISLTYQQPQRVKIRPWRHSNVERCVCLRAKPSFPLSFQRKLLVS